MTASTEEDELLKKCVLCKTRNKAKRVVSNNRKYGFEEQNNPDQIEINGIDLIVAEPTEFSLNISEVDFWGKNTSKK